MPLPQVGLDHADVIAALQAKRSGDVRWQEGRTFGLVFDGGPDAHAVAEEAALLFLHENALSTAAFPSLASIQSEIVRATADLLHGPSTAAGFVTSGGTESILLAVKAARERGRAERAITEPNLVLADSAHAAFHKGGHDFGVEVRTVPVAPDYRADVAAMAAAVDERTVLIVGSAPQYPQGVIDPIADLAALAVEAGANFHTDACMGGFVLPFMEMLGREVPPWDFRVEGVTSISADIHKLGYAPKGASVIVHRTKELRRYQTFVFDGWLGGLYASPNLQGTRSALPMATAWAVMHRLGIDGYVERTRATLEAADRLRSGVRSIDGLAVLADPTAHLLAITSASVDLDIGAVHRGVLDAGWYLDLQGPPSSMHATVSLGNVEVIDEFLGDLAAAVRAAREGATAGDQAPGYATLE